MSINIGLYQAKLVGFMMKLQVLLKIESQRNYIFRSLHGIDLALSYLSICLLNKKLW